MAAGSPWRWHSGLLLCQVALLLFFTWAADLIHRDRHLGTQYPGHLAVCLIFMINGIFFLVNDEKNIQWREIARLRGWAGVLAGTSYVVGTVVTNNWHGNPPHDFLRWGRHVSFCMIVVQCGAIMAWASRKNWREVYVIAEGLLALMWVAFGLVHLHHGFLSQMLHILFSAWGALGGLAVILRHHIAAGSAYLFAAYITFAAQNAACDYYKYQAAAPLTIVAFLHMIPLSFVMVYISVFRDNPGEVEGELSQQQSSDEAHNQQSETMESTRLVHRDTHLASDRPTSARRMEDVELGVTSSGLKLLSPVGG
uniref:Uncharacterized protein n=2 Tax=Lotharella globosa TaxID=91324 RepID=A0A7S3ZBP7_9EUKA|mmetsp:Transcript_21283/g.41303  ORF Transcript_21283/g.41303 Transcript_21283/m.41303 type:complete len:310 (+) Transcript_21283:24-953(+)